VVVATSTFVVDSIGAEVDDCTSMLVVSPTVVMIVEASVEKTSVITAVVVIHGLSVLGGSVSGTPVVSGGVLVFRVVDSSVDLLAVVDMSEPVV
jgi:hypothetical protein